MKFFLALIVILASSYDSLAQDRIETDRPNETEIPHIVPKGFVQIEAGVHIEKTASANETVHHPVAVLKYGISPRFEFRLKTTMSTEILHADLKDISQTGLEPVEAGFKVLLWEGAKVLPKTSLIAMAGIPMLASEKFRTLHVAPRLRMAMENTVTDHFTVSYNTGVEWDGMETTPSWLYTISPSVDITKKLHAFVEAFGFIKKGEAPEHSLDGGFQYLLQKNVAVDVSSGFGISESAPHFFIAFGGSIRFR